MSDSDGEGIILCVWRWDCTYKFYGSQMLEHNIIASQIILLQAPGLLIVVETEKKCFLHLKSYLSS